MINRKQKQIIAYLLIAIMTVPSLWQLEHIFDNDHGIVYHRSSTEIVANTGNSCGSLHKSLQYIYWHKIPVINTLITVVFSDVPVQKPVNYHLPRQRSFLLRAPPYCS